MIAASMASDALEPFQAVTCGLATEIVLMAGVVINDPLPPEGCHCVQVQHAPAPARVRLNGPCRGGIETDPSVAWKICLDPRMRVAGANQVLGSEVVKLSRAETVHHPRGNAQRAQHDGHRG